MGPLSLMACPGCSLSQSKPKGSRKGASFACYLTFDLYRTIRIEPKSAYVHKIYVGVDLHFKLSPHTIRLSLTDHVSRLDCTQTILSSAPLIAPLGSRLDLFEDASIRQSLKIISSSLSLCSYLRFYSD